MIGFSPKQKTFIYEFFFAKSCFFFLRTDYTNSWSVCACLVAKSCLTLWPHGLQHPGFPVLHYLPEFAQIHVLWLKDSIQPPYSVSLFSSCPQSLPASGSLPKSQLFASGGQSIGASASVLPMNIQCWSPLGLIGWISLLSRDSQESSLAPQF